MRLHRAGGVVGERIAPQQVGDGVGRQRAVGVQEEGGDEPSLEIAAQRDRRAVAARHGERPEHAITGLALPGHAARVYEAAGQRLSIRPARTSKAG